jgi:RHS repeat-associated protein
VSDLEYNARGQRLRCVQGNGTVTTYEYDARTFRLARLRLVREVDAAVLQDLRYTYDPSGNVMQIRDGAQQARFFANAVVSGDQRFEYSAVYRLVRATGREHASLGQPVDQDFAFGPQPHPDDPAALREYTQEYRWDVVGNLLRLQHGAAGGSYTRQYAYAAAGNRLLRNSAPGEAVEPFSHSYSYDEHGNMIAMPHLAAMAWDHADRLQHADLGGGGDVWFVYDAAGERVRKVQVNVAGSVVRERVYLGGVELYRERAANSATPTLVRESLHVGDDTGRLCLVETLTVRDGVEVASPVSVQRHQYGNHLGSASLELDGDAAVISYEEFHPFGTTSYAANDAGIEFSAKRYRYIGKERDEETGLYHLGARYYASWLGRWTAADPIGLGDGENRYAYVQGNPARLVDSDGMKAEDPYAKLRETHAKWNAEVPPRAAENEDGKPDTGGAGFGKPIRRAAPTQPERTPPPPAPAGPGATGEPGWRGPPSEAPNWLARLAAAAAAFRSADSRSGSGAGSSMLERVAAAFAVMSGGRGKFDAKETKLGLGSEDTGDGSGLPPGLVIAAVAAREAAYGGALGVAGRLLGGVGGLLRKVGAEKLAGMLDDLAERVRAMRSVPQAPASSAMNARELKRQLTLEEASAVFTESGALHPEVIAESGVAIPGGRLGKPTADFLTADGSKIDDWAKYTTKTFKSPAGDFQVHFYMNSKTGAVNYDRDYKAVFNDQGVR